MMELLTQKIYSSHNEFWFWLRNQIRWSRSGYSESAPQETPFVPAAQDFNERYSFADYGTRLYPRHWIRNLATLWLLEKMLEGLDWPTSMTILEPCCQDFVRLPAISRFFEKQKVKVAIVGVEIDTYVPLKGFYSRWDHAQYYRSIVKSSSEYHSADFFKFTHSSDLILCFYPFVLSSPALAWGLPARVANANQWVEAFERNLKPKGRVLVVHQGEWEEAEFDKARKTSALNLLKRRSLNCDFFPAKYMMSASLYER